VAGRKAGDKVKVTLMRGSHRTEVTVTLGERPATSTP
jgi:S1-C subfamily serine protease